MPRFFLSFVHSVEVNWIIRIQELLWLDVRVHFASALHNYWRLLFANTPNTPIESTIIPLVGVVIGLLAILPGRGFIRVYVLSHTGSDLHWFLDSSWS